MRLDNKYYLITYYQGEHSNEYLVQSLGDSYDEGIKLHGPVQLFENGIIKFSWREMYGEKGDPFRIYVNGKQKYELTWSEIFNKNGSGETRYLEQIGSQVFMLIRDDATNNIIYQGSYSPAWRKQGHGYEFDRQTGDLLRFCQFDEDEPFQIVAHFNKDIVTEFWVEDHENNMSLSKRKPTYIGGYQYDKEKVTHYHHGKGTALDRHTGHAVYEGVWDCGKETSSRYLTKGWQSKEYREFSIRTVLEKKDPTSVINETIRLNMYGIDKLVEELVIPSNCCNEKEFKSLTIERYYNLKTINIGKVCFSNVTHVNINNLANLKSVRISSSFFGPTIETGSFAVSNCPVLTSLYFFHTAFTKYNSCQLNSNTLCRL